MEHAEKLLSAADADQKAMMEEQVILTDYYDNDIGAGSKKETHIMTNINAGMLHRAFSVFLITPDGKLVLQQRSPLKITFPLIWANTCCSHPLHMTSETILDDAMGVKNAARRKLQQELGIPPEDVPLESFTWITRVHYMGVSNDGASPGFWGEHEIDWILLCTPRTMPRMNLNPNEVAATRAFTQAELREWMATRPEHGNQVSPWFGVMEAAGLVYRWWTAALERNIASVLERGVIYRQHDLEAIAAGARPGSVPMPAAFRATLEATKATAPTAIRYTMPCADGSDAAAFPHAAVQGKGRAAASRAPTAPTSAAASAPTAAEEEAAAVPGASVAKQGAYGKVKIHSESLISQLSHVDEVVAGVAYKLGLTSATHADPLPADASPSLIFAERILCKVSRSFALVIQRLPPHLRTSVGVFYLVLRGLDTVEDDMQAFKGREAEKLAHLRAFHRYLLDPNFCMSGIGEGDEAALLKSFFHINAVFATLHPVDREVIADITARMGEGMASFAGRDLREGTEDLGDYNLYCYYVAGLVGEGLTRLFVTHGDESPALSQNLKLAHEMGLFLQKTNIIRDYLEDLVEGRAFWPKEVWSQYSAGLSNLRHKVSSAQAGAAAGTTIDDADARDQADAAVACLNHLIADAMQCAPSCLRYMAGLRDPHVFRFCAVPQVMAIATLDALANNPQVFTGVVKIRKGQAIRLIMACEDMQSVYSIFLSHARSIAAKIPRHHKFAVDKIAHALEVVEAIAMENLPASALTGSAGGIFGSLLSGKGTAVVFVIFAFLLRYLYLRSREGGWGTGSSSYLPRITDSTDVLALAGLVACIMFLFGLAGVPFALQQAQTATTPMGKGAGANSDVRGGVAYDAFGWSEVVQIPYERVAHPSANSGLVAASGAGAGAAGASLRVRRDSLRGR